MGSPAGNVRDACKYNITGKIGRSCHKTYTEKGKSKGTADGTWQIQNDAMV